MNDMEHMLLDIVNGLPKQPDESAIRFGLGAIRNVGETTAKAIITARDSDGQFTSIYDLCQRVELNRRALESLIKSGALDSFGWNRAQLWSVIDDAVKYGKCRRKDKRVCQAGLFDALPDIQESDMERARRERKGG